MLSIPKVLFSILGSFHRTFYISRKAPLVKLGHGTEGWNVPVGSINPQSICYCAGVGDDTSFDEALIQSTGCEVWAFDPTFTAINYVAKRGGTLPSKFHHLHLAIHTSDEPIKFHYAKHNTSLTTWNIPGYSRTFYYPARSMGSIMVMLDHHRIDLLKMDIEWSEYEVIPNMIKTGIKPSILCVEIHPHPKFWKSHLLVTDLIAYGYDLVGVDGCNYTFTV